MPLVQPVRAPFFLAGRRQFVAYNSSLIPVIDANQRPAQYLQSRAGWWMCASLTILLTFNLNYSTFHVATQFHVIQSLAPGVHLDFHQHHHSDKDTGHSHHLPHPATDHSLELGVRVKTTVDNPPLFALLPIPGILPSEALRTTELYFVEPIKPIGESPPDPTQPRAPPVV